MASIRSIKRNPWMLCDPANMRATDRKMAGVYALYREGRLIYVGQSKHLQWRPLDHKSRLQFDAVKVRRVDDETERRWLERKLLFRLRPPMNGLIPVVLREQWTNRCYAELR